MKKEALRLTGVSARDYSFGGLKEASFTLYEGETIALAGLFKSGKITLVRILSGDPIKYAGDIFIQGQRITPDDNTGIRSNKIVLISDIRRLFVNINLYDNIYISQTGKSLWAPVRHDSITPDVHILLEELGIEFSKKHVDQLSDFEKLKFEILKSYVSGARIFIFVNFSMYLTEQEVQKLVHIVRFLNTWGISVILEGDDYFPIFEEVVSRCLVVRGGVVTTILYKDENDIFDEDRMRHAIVGRAFDRRYEVLEKVALRTDASPYLKVGSTMDGKTLLEAREGDIIGIYDRLDQLPKTVEGLMLYLGKGIQLTISDAPFQPRKILDLVRRSVAVITKEISDQPIFLNLSPVENVCIFAQRLFGKPVIYKRSTSEYLFNRLIRKHRILRHCEGLQMEKDCFGLSYEQKYELMIAKWLAFNPKIIVLFTPLSNMDTKNAEHYKDWHASMSNEGKVQILISSNYESLDGICTDIVSI